jgi:tetratricopeptide (TPR) repeat protein
MASSLWRYWQIRGGVGEGRAYLERLLDASEPVAPAVRATALAAAGRLAFVYGDLERAAALVDASLDLEREPGDRALSLSVLAGIEQARGAPARASRLLDESVAVSRDAKDWFAHAVALIVRGEILYVAGEFDAARRSLAEGLRAAREAGDVRNIARGLTALGAVALEQRDYDVATQRLEEALATQGAGARLSDWTGRRGCARSLR